MQAFQILLVDDNQFYRASLADLLARSPTLRVVAQAESAPEALALSAGLDLDLAIVDLVLPGPSGFELTRRLKAGPRPPMVVTLTLHAAPSYRRAAFEAGADAFLTKDLAPLYLVDTISRLFAGKAVPGPAARQ